MQMANGFAQAISTHAPRTGSDKFAGSVVSFCRISTHAPRTGSDHAIQRGSYGTRYFNPRSPHGERLYFSHTLIRSERFQPTLPARGATNGIVPFDVIRRISTHAPRTGSDAYPAQYCA